jgi:EAL domain-containing protein (putative c-di-GMP-specific phosphodiesterase class I)
MSERPPNPNRVAQETPTLGGRLAWLLPAVLVPAWIAALLAFGMVAHGMLQKQWQERQVLAAAMLAAALGAQGDDESRWRALAASAFATESIRRLEVVGPQGGRLFDEARTPASDAAEGEAGVARVEPTGGQVRLELDTGAAPQALAAVVGQAGLALAAIFALALALWHSLLRGMRRPLAAIVEQARAIEQSRFVIAEEPALAELGGVARAMNSMARRLREKFEQQADQVARLQREAHTDPVSGLPVRAQVLARLTRMLAEPAGPAVTLLLVRLTGLDRLNERHGREAVDRLLQGLGDLLLTYVERVPGTCAGRLNGTDFALGLPASGVARETAESLRETLRAMPAARLGGAEFLVGGCDGLRGIGVGDALAAVDAALARAEQEEGIAVIDLPDAAAGGARAWREQIADALAQGRVQLGAYPVVDAQGGLIHLECPLRVQLLPDGEFQVARRWLALATRSRLLHETDLAAARLALAAIDADGQPRAVHVAPRSFLQAGFAPELMACLEARPAAAARLAVEWSGRVPPEAWELLRTAVAAWRRLGVSVGIEHAGASPRDLNEAESLGIDYVKVDAQHLRGLADDEAVRDYVQGLVTLIHDLGKKAIAQGVDEPRDVPVLWKTGFDGATGAAFPRESD